LAAVHGSTITRTTSPRLALARSNCENTAALTDPARTKLAESAIPARPAMRLRLITPKAYAADAGSAGVGSKTSATRQSRTKSPWLRRSRSRTSGGDGPGRSRTCDLGIKSRSERFRRDSATLRFWLNNAESVSMPHVASRSLSAGRVAPFVAPSPRWIEPCAERSTSRCVGYGLVRSQLRPCFPSHR
jgi:hypothetical protein